ncbi:HotDog domain-containing protein [Endogone sp. FLAS-F59071]|nr:HotDog domain-containing protein [Endogone sp. FLAS-F59071]|eukprot:RUS17955.1 HotDog domain-containing protein [Endogone sp. FLAS-F59071]
MASRICLFYLLRPPISSPIYRALARLARPSIIRVATVPSLVFVRSRAISSTSTGTLSGKPLREPQPTKAVEDLVKGYHCVMNQIVAWGDQDAYGHLNNVQYIRYFESGRMAFLERMKPHLPPKLFSDFVYARGVGPIVKSITCKYRQIVEFPDTLAIATKVTNMSADRFTMAYIAVSHKTEQVVAEGECIVVTYNYRTSQKAPVPQEMVELARQLEKEARERLAKD